ncbi:MAG: LTA synthase family protein [Fibrobacter sp.]|nr:LTA synthase family protein [Fibrobacter sp.]
MSTHIHYVIACLIFEVLFVLVHRKSSNVKQLFGMIFIPITLYIFTYRYPVLTILVWGQVYATSLICFVVTVFLCTLSFESPKTERVQKKVPIIIALVSFVLIFVAYGIPWLVRAFPLNNPDAVLFTLLQNKAGTEDFVWNLIYENVLSPTLKVYVPASIVFFALAMAIYFSKKTWRFGVFKCSIRLYAGESIWVTLKQFYRVLFLCSLLVFFVVVPKLILPLKDLCGAYFESSKRQNSQLYLSEYVFPDSVIIKFPSTKRNLIYIMLESMEVNFKDYTSEINRITEENISFMPGGVDVTKTGWTMAAQVAKLCGVPLFLPEGMDNNDSIHSFLPNIKCLTDALAENGYEQVYVQGSDGTFSSKRNFWNQHNVDKFHDFPYYKKEKIVPRDNEIFWGLSDKTLYWLMQRELKKFEENPSKPFALYAMTVDTHFPEGNLSEGCVVSETEPSQYPSILRCASKQLDSFLQWAKMQSWYENTVIVIVGDHTWSTFTELLNLPKEDPLYWINIFVNSHQQPKNTDRYFCSFDMYPTVLEAMGAEIEGHRLGLGTSLFSDEKTLLEKMPKTILDSLLRIKSYQYDYFMQGGSFVGE